MNHNRMLAFSFGAVGVALLSGLFVFSDFLYFILLQFIVWAGHGCVLFYVYKRVHKVVPLPVHFESPVLLHEPSPMYRTDVDDPMLGVLYEKLLCYFKTEKPYLKSGINVAEVASRIYSNRAYLSRLLNAKLNLNFHRFVNGYRIMEAKRLVSDEGPIALSELCKRVGFTSMASFTVAFKLNTGMTPGEWCKKQKRLS
jgi:AraC-like DNA-binding protein